MAHNAESNLINYPINLNIFFVPYRTGTCCMHIVSTDNQFVLIKSLLTCPCSYKFPKEYFSSPSDVNTINS